VAQPVKHPTLDFSLGLDLGVVGSSPVLGSTLSVEPTLKKIRSRYFHLSYMPVFLTSSLSASPLSCPLQNYNYTVPLTLGPSYPVSLLPQDFLYTRVPTWTLLFP